MCFALLTGAGLFLESLHRLSTVDLGYRPDRVLTAEVFSNWSRQTDNAAFIRLYTTIVDRLRQSPAVASAAVTNAVPLTNIGPIPQPIRIDGLPSGDPNQLPIADRNVASEQYFDVLGVRPQRGRVFTSGDYQHTPPPCSSPPRPWPAWDPRAGRRRLILCARSRRNRGSRRRERTPGGKRM